LSTNLSFTFTLHVAPIDVEEASPKVTLSA
jgi:hypothetical protein